MRFKYQGIDRDGRKVNSTIEANDMEDAKSKLKATGLVLISINILTAPFWEKMGIFYSKEIPSKKLATLSRDLAIYMQAGISIVNAVRLARTQYNKDKRMLNFLLSISTLLDEGKSFYLALENQNIYEIPSFYKQTIRISESGGMLSSVLSQLSDYLKEQEKTAKQITSALAYPSFIIVVSIGMVAFMLTVVVPKITAIFSSMHQELPAITKVVIASGDFLGAYWLFLTVGFVTIVSSFSIAYKQSVSFALKVDSFLLYVPGIGKIIEVFELARFSYISSVLIKSGVPFAQTIRLSANILKNSLIRKQFENAANKVVEGERLSNALMREGFKIQESFIQAVALGEETSEVSAVMQNLSTLYFEENKDKITIFMSLLEPALMLFVGSAIGFIVVAMLLPIFSMNLS